jgi:Ca2+-binding EF-hand superfamily protein
MIVGRSKKLATTEEIGKIFDQADLDGSGTLTTFELKHMLIKLHLSEEELTTMLKQFDEDGDGNV